MADKKIKELEAVKDPECVDCKEAGDFGASMDPMKARGSDAIPEAKTKAVAPQVAK